MKNFIFNNFVAAKVGAAMSKITGHRTQWGLGISAALFLAEYFAPIPAGYTKYIDQLITIVLSATGVTMSDKFRRNYEIAQSMAKDAISKIPVDPNTVP